MAEQQQVITLDHKNSIEILCSYVEVAQKSGAFLLAESDILKRCKDVLLKGAQDQEINTLTARNLFVQAVNKGQSKGCYSLEDSSILFKVCQYISTTETQPQPPQAPQSTQPAQQIQQVDDDLNSLSDPVPLRSGPKII